MNAIELAKELGFEGAFREGGLQTKTYADGSTLEYHGQEEVHTEEILMWLMTELKRTKVEVQKLKGELNGKL